MTAIHPAGIAGLVASAPYEIRSFRIDPDGLTAVWSSDDAVVLAYEVHEEIGVDGARVSLHAFDSSVWQREGGEWRCVLHTESIAGDAFGRDRPQA